MTNYETYRTHVAYLAGNLQRDFFSANDLIKKLFDEEEKELDPVNDYRV